MTVDDRENVRPGDAPRPLHAEQAVIPQTGDAGVVETHGGDTSLGTTPIGLGSVGPVQQHQQATEMILGQTESAEEAAEPTPPLAAGPALRRAPRLYTPVAGTHGRGGILEKIKGTFKRSVAAPPKKAIAIIVAGLVGAATAVSAFALRRRR